MKLNLFENAWHLGNNVMVGQLMQYTSPMNIRWLYAYALSRASMHSEYNGKNAKTVFSN